MMAAIEEAEHGAGSGQAREWLARAARAPRDPVWIADGIASDTWAPVSPVTGRLDAFAWREPPNTLAAAPAVEPEPSPSPPQPVLAPATPSDGPILPRAGVTGQDASGSKAAGPLPSPHAGPGKRGQG